MSNGLNEHLGDLRRVASSTADRPFCYVDRTLEQIQQCLEHDIKPAVRQLISSQPVHWDDQLADWLDRQRDELQQVVTLADQAAQRTKASLLRKPYS